MTSKLEKLCSWGGWAVTRAAIEVSSDLRKNYVNFGLGLNHPASKSWLRGCPSCVLNSEQSCNFFQMAEKSQ